MQDFNIRNYTSSVPVNHDPEGMIFQLPVEGKGALTFKLPSNIIGVQRLMESKIKNKRRVTGTQNRIIAQAQRTAWKILFDWVDIQITMIKCQQAEAVQIFLPYVCNEKGETLFERIKSNNFLLPE